MRIRTLALLLAASAASWSDASAQEVAPGVSGDSGRTALQARVRQRLAVVVRQRLKLNDDQMRQLTAVNANYEPRRRALVMQERDSRIVVRGELQRGDRAANVALQDRRGAAGTAKRLKAGRIRVGGVTCHGGCDALERGYGRRLIDVDHGIKLIGDPRLEVVRCPLGLRAIYDPHRAFEQWFAQSSPDVRRREVEIEARQPRVVK